jgi:hypothetical protein
MFNTVSDDLSINSDAMHCEAYNAAFYELGLNWYWDVDTYRKLLAQSAGVKDCILVYLETLQPHMLKVYDAAFLINAIQPVKERCYQTISTRNRRLIPNANWAEIQKIQVGI